MNGGKIGNKVSVAFSALYAKISRKTRENENDSDVAMIPMDCSYPTEQRVIKENLFPLFQAGTGVLKPLCGY